MDMLLPFCDCRLFCGLILCLIEMPLFTLSFPAGSFFVVCIVLFAHLIALPSFLCAVGSGTLTLHGLYILSFVCI